MDFGYSDDQRLLKDSVERFVQDHHAFEQRRKLVATEDGYSEDNWKQFAELGWLGMPFPEEYGGFGGTASVASSVVEAFRHGLVAEAFLPAGAHGRRRVLLRGRDGRE